MCKISDHAILLYSFVSSTGDFDEAERIIDEIGSPPLRLVPSVRAAQAMLQGVRGRRTTSRSLARQALATARAAVGPLLLGRVLSRCAMGAYYLGDYDEARDLALEASYVFESNGGFAAAASTWSIAAAIAQDWNGEGSLAVAHWRRMTENAERAGHDGVIRSSLAARFNVAAELFDAAEYASLKAMLSLRPVAQQHQENYVLTISDALGYGWKGDFEAAEITLLGHSTFPGLNQSQLALIEALLSLIDAARWDVDSARTRSRAALQRTAQRPANEPLHDLRFRGLARILAAATCFVIGDRVRGERALSARFDPGRRYVNLIATPFVDVTKSPELFRGYAEFIRVASAHARAARPSHGLTPAELEVLRVLPGGATLAELARELEKSKNTVARQVESIYAKLNARNRAQAIETARSFGVFS